MQSIDEHPAALSTEIPVLMNPTMIQNSVDTGVNLANSVIAIAKEVGETLNHVPYVKSISGILLHIIKVRDEVKSNKERCREIIEKVLRLTKSILERLTEVAQSQAKDKLIRLEGHLGDYNRTLTSVSAALEKYKSRRRLVKYINRGLDELDALDRRVDELNTTLILDMLTDIKLEQAVAVLAPREDQLAAPNPSTNGPEHILPAKPSVMVEREAQVDIALKILLSSEPSRIAIIGGGGFGKTTLARTILHDSGIVEHYQLRYFLSCEGMPNIGALLLGIGAMLGLKVSPSAILASARRMLQMSTTLLCLDNFETPWEPFDTRTKVEELLEAIADIPNLSLVITMRGEQRPSKVAWSKPLLPPLSTLSLDGAKLVLQSIASDHNVDEFTLQLLQAIDGIPLAVTLISTLLRDGESSESLWRRWSTNYTQVVHTGGDDRQSNLNRSIALSIYSLRMNKDGDASRQLLAVLSLLPDGFPFNHDALANLQNYLSSDTSGIHPVGFDIRSRFQRLRTTVKGAPATRMRRHQGLSETSPHAPNKRIDDIYTNIETLRTVALIRVDQNCTSPRINMLSPIRLFCQVFLSSEVSLMVQTIVNYYISSMLNARFQVDNSEIYVQVVPEIQNVHSVFQKGYKSGYSQEITRLLDATAILTDWSTYIGYLTQDTVQTALERSTNLPISHAKCLCALGELHCAKGSFSEAKACFIKATDLFKQGGDPIQQAHASHRVGDMLMFFVQLDQAEVTFQASLKLCTQADNKQGQADADNSLGYLYLMKDQYPEAEESLRTALEAYKQTRNLLGQSNAAQNLSMLHNALGNLAKAEEFATEALDAAKRANDARGEGNALGQLGYIYLSTDRVAEAKQALEKALVIHKQQNAIISQLITVCYLGEVYIQLDQLSAAETLLTASAKMELDVIQIPKILTTLGWLYIRGGHLDQAKHYLDDALKFFQKFGDISWQPNISLHLGTVYLKSNRLDDAERVLKSIPDLGKWESLKIHRLWILGDLYTIKGQLEDAETALNSAMAHCQNMEHSYSYQQGNILRSMGALHMKRRRIDRAIRAFKRAREFHQKAQWVSEQATDLQQLGEAYEMLGRSEEAEAAFKDREALMETVREARVLSEL